MIAGRNGAMASEFMGIPITAKATILDERLPWQVATGLVASVAVCCSPVSDPDFQPISVEPRRFDRFAD